MLSRRIPLRACAGLVLLTVSACKKAPTPDAYGTFEATEVVVSAQSGGTLLRFDPAEGAHIDSGAVVATIDSAPIVLERAQLAAQRSGASARSNEVAGQAHVLRVQLQYAERILARTQRLKAENAATADQLDQAEREVSVLRARIAAAGSQQEASQREVSTGDARLASLADQLSRTRVVAPIGGTVLATYVRRGELVQRGQPLFRIAPLDSLDLRAYVSEPQLAQIAIGASMDVHVDRGGSAALTLPGRVTWIASKAEFTPTPIQTRDERANLVYAFKVRVANPNGVLKIGMPADVTLLASSPPARSAAP